ncbi:MAG: sulfatase-like hydrolase/transferase, partial [Bacteroidota bacterium]
MKHLIPVLALWLLGGGFSCSNNKAVNSDANTATITGTPPNILFIIADDLGSDAFSSYGIGEAKPKMPNLERLAKDGLRFTNFWAYPTCTPTRASIITGKHAYSTNVRQVGDHLSTEETTIQQFVKEKSPADYSNAVIGKWHLSEDADHPNQMGVAHFSGILSGGVRDYSAWRHVENGKTSQENSYITTKFTDLAIDWIQKQQKEWFLWMAYTAPHTPFHLPPNNLHSSDDLPNSESDIESNPQPYFFSMIEAL